MRSAVVFAVFTFPSIALLACGYLEPFPAAVPVGWGTLAGEAWAALCVACLVAATRDT